ncbi:Ig-like domain-containing protein [candidate division WOR-3 bacterium]|nr:Ig-like domain-containing protein [candidate division WOR-3 bacterium]
MKKIILTLVSLMVITIGCAKKDLSPVSPSTSVSTTDRNPLHVTDISGTIIDKPDSVGVDPSDEASWIYIHFDDVVNTASAGILVKKTNGDTISFSKEWSVSGGETDLILKPSSNLDYNTTYILWLIASEVSDQNGNLLDNDGDGKTGENPDDNIWKAFTTFKVDGSRGNWPSNPGDIVHPWRNSGVYFLIGGTTTSYIWTDVDVAVDIMDLDSNYALTGVDPNTINSNTVMIIEKNSGYKVPLESITYEGDTSASDFGRVLLKPQNDLKPATTYFLRLLGSIADKAGNKLDENNYIAYEGYFTTLACNHDSTVCAEDVTPPSVVAWHNLGSSFEVEFSERIDRNTITLSTIYLSYPGYGEGVLTVRDEDGHTIVKFTRGDGNSVSGYTAYVTGEIKDLAGNRKGGTSSHNF